MFKFLRWFYSYDMDFCVGSVLSDLFERDSKNRKQRCFQVKNNEYELSRKCSAEKAKIFHQKWRKQLGLQSTWTVGAKELVF
jgi:hypothetical protein